MLLDKFEHVAPPISDGPPKLDVAAAGAVGSFAFNRPLRAAAHFRVFFLQEQIVEFVHVLAVGWLRATARIGGTMVQMAGACWRKLDATLESGFFVVTL
jgi:hypothetical protein